MNPRPNKSVQPMKQSRDADDVNLTSTDTQDASGEVETRAQEFAVGSELRDAAAVLTQHRHEILNRWLHAASRQPFHRGHRRSLDESREDVLATTIHDIRQPATGIRRGVAGFELRPAGPWRRRNCTSWIR
jgi:signal transduction histidine kinase